MRYGRLVSSLMEKMLRLHKKHQFRMMLCGPTEMETAAALSLIVSVIPIGNHLDVLSETFR